VGLSETDSIGVALSLALTSNVSEIDADTDGESVNDSSKVRDSDALDVSDPDRISEKEWDMDSESVCSSLSEKLGDMLLDIDSDSVSSSDMLEDMDELRVIVSDGSSVGLSVPVCVSDCDGTSDKVMDGDDDIVRDGVGVAMSDSVIVYSSLEESLVLNVIV